MHQLLFLLLLLFLPDATSSAPAAGPSCNRQCGSTTVPYPFGFSSGGGGGGGGGDCPILLACNASASTALLPRSSTAYPVLSFNSTASTFLVSLAPSCGRGVAEAQAALAGASYGVTSRTGLFLRGGCGPATGGSSNSTGCNVPSGVMAAILRTAQGGAGGNDTSWACVLSAPPPPGSPAAARGKGQFMRWDKVAAAGCDDALTSALYAYTAQGVPSIDFGIAEMGWWVDGRCNGTSALGQQCARNATCHDVQTPSGAWGHRCACVDGMSGDAAGDGCRYDDGAPRGYTKRNSSEQQSVREKARTIRV